MRILLLYCSCFLLFAVLSTEGSSQTASLSLGNTGVCNAPSVLIPLRGMNLSNIGAITLYIKYDSNRLTFKSIENIDPQISNLLFNQLTNPARISIVWSSAKGANFANSLMLNIKFDVTGDSGNLNFSKDSCEVAMATLPPQVIPVDYLDGSFFQGAPVITGQPSDQTVHFHSNIAFEVSSPDATSFRWQFSANNGMVWSNLNEDLTFTGVSSNILHVSNVPLLFNNYRFRCKLDKPPCSLFSNEALLKVDSVWDVPESEVPGMNLKILPNPVCNQSVIVYSVPVPGKITIELYSSTGEKYSDLVNNYHFSGEYTLRLNFVYLPIGLYFCKYRLETTDRVYYRVGKVIKSCQ